MKRPFYDKTQIHKENLLFSNRDLLLLLVPLFIEQFLNSMMGMADTMMVSRVGSTAVSAASLVDSITNLIIQVFAALATGGTILCSQYIGKKQLDKSNEAARQVFLTVLSISSAVMLLCLVFRVPLLSLLFGKVETEVMEQSLTYFSITVLSYPCIALFQMGSALYRSCGKSKYPMQISALSNLINIGGNAVLIFGFRMGITGAALATLFSRTFCMVLVLWKLRSPKQEIVLKAYLTYRPNLQMIHRILWIAVPAGIENGMFQFGKLAIQSSVSTLATQEIAAQAMTIIFEMVNNMAGSAVGIGMMTVVGQCMGANRKEEAKYFSLRLLAIAEVGIFISCILVYALAFPVTALAGMEPESRRLCLQMTGAVTIVKPILWGLSFIPAYAMRSAGDVKFPMLVSSLSMWFCRVFLTVFLIRVMGFGPFAVWIGMFTDWGIRAIIFSFRYFSGKWLRYDVI